jgi:hypothetical protein
MRGGNQLRSIPKHLVLTQKDIRTFFKTEAGRDRTPPQPLKGQ